MTDTQAPEQTSSPTELIDTEFKSLYENLAGFSKQTRDLQEQVRKIQRTFKYAEKQTRTRKKKPQEKMNLSSDLAKFLSVNSSTKLTKAEVMKSISEYIKTKNLQVKDNKRKFSPDAKLTKVFGMPKSSQLTFVEINKHVSSHLSR
jgi:chromatin remodeling complex protein RSC6